MKRILDLIRLEHRERKQIFSRRRASAAFCSAVRAPRRWPDWEAITTPAPPFAMTLPNSSRTTAVPYRSTARIVAGEACDGETPAAWITPVISPRAAAISMSPWTEGRDDTSTVAVLTSNPASRRTLAAASAFSWRRSARTTCLPALTRRAMAWPIDPAPITTLTLPIIVLLGRLKAGGHIRHR